MFVVTGVAQAALEHEAGFGHLDHEQAARSIVDFPARMEPFEREISEGIECCGEQHGCFAGRFARDLVFERSDCHLGAWNGVHVGVEAFAFLNRAAVAAAIEAHLDSGDTGCAKRANYGLLEMLGLGLRLPGAFRLPLVKFGHCLGHIDHRKILLCWGSGGQSACHHWHRRGPVLWPDNASAASGAGAKADWLSVGRRRLRLGAGAERTAAIDDRDPARLGFDDQAFENAIAGERDDVARI